MNEMSHDSPLSENIFQRSFESKYLSLTYEYNCLYLVIMNM